MARLRLRQHLVMLTPAATAMLRTGAARSGGPQPLALRTVSATSSTAAASTPVSSNVKWRSTCTVLVARSPHHAAGLSPTVRPAMIPRNGFLLRYRPYSSTNIRQAPKSSSNDASRDATAAAAAAASAQSFASATEPPLDWNTFFQLRKTRRRWQLGFSVLTSLSSTTAGAVVLSGGAFETQIAKLPLDPFMTLGLITIACAALGWVVGPSIGNLVFGVMNSRYRAQMLVKEGQFFERIQRHRVDPTAGSMGNPVPDFYGEKISSVAGYRQWLKDQRAFNKKRTTFL